MQWGYNNTLTNFSIIKGGHYGINLALSANNTFKDCLITNSEWADVHIGWDPGSTNNTLVNCSYSTELVRPSDNGEIIRKWYYQSYTNYSNGNPASNVNITAYNSSGNIQFTTQTNSSGWTNRQEVIEYINLNGTRRYYNNYTINATLSGYEGDSNVFNFTTTKNKIDDVFTLQ